MKQHDCFGTMAHQPRTCLFVAGKLLVNFDKSILTVIREAKWLQRMGMSVPEAAMLLLLQEEKYKLYFNNLQHALQASRRHFQTICCS